jgi:hypothetical protein
MEKKTTENRAIVNEYDNNIATIELNTQTTFANRRPRENASPHREPNRADIPF